MIRLYYVLPYIFVFPIYSSSGGINIYVVVTNGEMHLHLSNAAYLIVGAHYSHSIARTLLEEFAHYLGLGLLDFIAARFQNNRSFTVVILAIVTSGCRPILANHLTDTQKLAS